MGFSKIKMSPLCHSCCNIEQLLPKLCLIPFNHLFIAPPNNVPISVINLLIQKYSRIIQFNLRDALENLVLWSYCLDVEIDGGGVLGLEELCLILVCGC